MSSRQPTVSRTEAVPLTISSLALPSHTSVPWEKHGTDVWLGNAKDLITSKTATVDQAIGCRDDIMLYLISCGMPEKRSFKIMEAVRKGRGLPEGAEEEMKAAGVPEWYIGSCKKIKYLFPKAHAVAYVMMAFRIAWFKVHHPLAFYSAYFYRRSQKGGFDAVLMTAGLCTIERKNLRCAAAMAALMAVNFAWLAVQLFGGSYQANANVYFPGFEQMAARAAEIQAETGEKINVTGNVYPHIQPSDGAEMMFLYATDADMRTVEAERGTRYETIYVSDDMQPEADQIYLARADEISNWDLEGFDYEESEGYALIYPAR